MSNFFDEQSQQSQIKSAIVANYFWSWGKVITGYQKGIRDRPRIAYIDLFAGKGRYADGSKSTPLLILERAVADETFREALVTIFNDKMEESVSTLKSEIAAIPGIEGLKTPPCVYCNEVGTEIVKLFDSLQLIPTLMFVDPWGYKGLSLRLINSVLKNWACECIFFFNYNRVSMGLSNPAVREHMEALFGQEQAERIQARIDGLEPDKRELTIVEELAQALKKLGGKYVLPFRFKNEKGTRTTHHLVFVSKNSKGYKIMKKVMAGESSTSDQGVASFTYNPAEAIDRANQPLLWELSRPLDDLEAMLLDTFAGQTLRMEDIYERHNVDKPYTDTNYKDVLRRMELAGKVTAQPPYTARRPRNGIPTFADSVLVTFPPRMTQ